MDAAPPERLPVIHSLLLAWYAVSARDLPWRHTSDPYAILVSEVMLQQTQVDRVIPKYYEFLEHFPTLATLAAATPGEVIRAWAPLGYNRRAVNLQRTAAIAVRDHDGRLPADAAALRRLPGVGEYTAAAVGCFAFGEDVAAVDTNVRRVLLRLAPNVSPTAAAIGSLASCYLPRGRAARWNQALMDLGATICRSDTALCRGCPLSSVCPSSGSVIRETRVRYAAGGQAQPFRESDRFLRGRMVDALRDAETLTTDGLALRVGVTDESGRTRLAGLISALERDGLLATDADGRHHLPG